MYSIDLMSRTPIYEQIYIKTIEMILKGLLSENDQIPSVRSLAKQINVNPNTIAKAYTQLEHDGIIYSLSGRGSFIANINSSAIKEYVFRDFDLSVTEALRIGITKTELKNRIDLSDDSVSNQKSNVHSNICESLINDEGDNS